MGKQTNNKTLFLGVQLLLFGHFSIHIKLENCPQWKAFVLVNVQGYFLYFDISLQSCFVFFKKFQCILRFLNFLVQQIFTILQLLGLFE